MKFNKLSVFMVLMFFANSAMSQKPEFGQLMGERVPMVCGSTGSGIGDSTRLPVMFQIKVLGLTPNSSYKYYSTLISLSDTSSTSFAGVGSSIFVKNGNWRISNNPNLNIGGSHDTFTMTMGMGDYTGWFGVYYNNNSRFAPGSYVYPMLVIEEIGVGVPVVKKLVAFDSIQVLEFGSTNNGMSGTAVYGQSFAKAKSIVTLYDNNTGMGRPIAATFAENDGLTYGSMPSAYNSKVNGVAGAWGTVLPNDLSTGIIRIESRNPFADTMHYFNVETDGVWGSDSLVNPHGGINNPIYIKSDFAPLAKPEFEFVVNSTNVNEANTVVNLLVRRRYGNADSSKVTAATVAGTATAGVDYDILTPMPMVFNPYGTLIDTIKVRIYDDFSSEPNENAAIRLVSTTNGKVGFQTTHSVVIVDNDLPIVTFADKVVRVAENDGVLKVKLKIASGSITPTNVSVVVKSKTDSTFIPQDFKIGNSNRDTIVTFAGGSGSPLDSMEFNIWLVNDNRSEDRNDTVVLVLRNPTSPAKVGVDSLLTIIISDDDAPSLFKFAGNKMTVSEDVGSVKLKIERTKGNIFQSDIILSADPDSKNAQAGDDFIFSPQLLSFDYSDPDSIIVTIPIVDDNISEARQDAVFIIRNSFNARIGKPDTFRVTINDNDLVEYAINKITSVKTGTQIVDSLNVHCAIRGVVYGVNLGPVGTNAGVTFTLNDRTAGIRVSQSGSFKGYPNVVQGDSLLIYGRVSQINGLTTFTNLDTIIKYASNRSLLPPLFTTFLDESTESELVKYNLVKLANPSQWPTSPLAPNTTALVKVLTSNDSFNIIIDSETDIDGKAAPLGFFDVVGLGSQNDPTSPYTSGYTLMPRSYSDFTMLTVPVFSFTTDTSIAVEKREFSEGFTLQCANLTNPVQISLVIQNSSTATRNIDYQSNAFRLFILTPAEPSVVVTFRMVDDILKESKETVVWAIKDNPWGTLIGADSIHTVYIIDDESVGLDELNFASKFNLYPNPASSIINLNSESAMIQSVEVIDVNGKVIKSFNQIDALETVLNIEDLSKGVYKLKINTNEGVAVKVLSIL